MGGYFANRAKNNPDEDMNKVTRKNARIDHLKAGSYVLVVDKAIGRMARKKTTGYFTAADTTVIALIAEPDVGTATAEGEKAKLQWMLDLHQSAPANWKSFLCACLGLAGKEEAIEVDVRESKDSDERCIVSLDWNQLSDWAIGEYSDDQERTNEGEQPLRGSLIQVQAYQTESTKGNSITVYNYASYEPEAD